MKTKLIGIISILLLSCNGQSEKIEKPTKNIVVIKKLKDNYLNKIKWKNQNGKTKFVEGDSIIELTNRNDIFLETKRKVNDSTYHFFAYDKKTNLMIASGQYFYKIPTGVFKRYNENGELIETINRDRNFSFSITELIDKIKTTYQIDLNCTTKVKTISRQFDKSNNRYQYMIIYKNNKNEKLKCLTIDGKTGKILGDVFVGMIK